MDVNDILDDLCEILTRKDSLYGTSFSKTFEEYGLTSLVIRLTDKLNRLKTLHNLDIDPDDEGIIDTLIDIAGYSVLGLKEVYNGNR